MDKSVKSYGQRNREGKQISRIKRREMMKRKSKDDDEEREPRYLGKWADKPFNKIMNLNEIFD